MKFAVDTIKEYRRGKEVELDGTAENYLRCELEDITPTSS
jgi:hypothetical protein